MVQISSTCALYGLKRGDPGHEITEYHMKKDGTHALRMLNRHGELSGWQAKVRHKHEPYCRELGSLCFLINARGLVQPCYHSATYYHLATDTNGRMDSAGGAGHRGLGI